MVSEDGEDADDVAGVPKKKDESLGTIGERTGVKGMLKATAENKGNETRLNENL